MKNQFEEFFIALEEAINRVGGAAKLAKQANISIASLVQWRDRKRNPGLENIVSLLPYINWPVKNARMRRMGENSPEEIVIGDNLKFVPVIMEAGAGNAIEVWNQNPLFNIPVLEQYYRDGIRAVKVAGDSMEPTIKKGAVVGIIPIQEDLIEGQIYLIYNPPFGYVVKRIRCGKQGNIVLYSDNPSYPPIELSVQEYEKIIIGKVFWVWQEI